MFDASRLFDGVASSLLVKLAAHRGLRDPAWWRHDRRRLSQLVEHPPPDGSFYVRSSRNLATSIRLEDAQWAQFHECCHSGAAKLYRAAARSGGRSPLLAAQAHLGLHAVLENRTHRELALRRARDLSTIAAAESLLDEISRRERGEPAVELFFP